MPSCRAERGITLLESLVAILVVATGVFGVLSIQLRTLADAQAGMRRSQAIRLIEDLSERIHANPPMGDYLSTHFVDISGIEDCTQPCNTNDWAAREFSEWQKRAQSSLGNGRALVFQGTADSGSGTPRQLGVMIAWKENMREGAEPETTKALNQFLQLSASDASQQTCPEQYVCHLQYIGIPGHCVAERASCP
ncbi:type IV pilus modification protein PilV [Diaphorobacter aerolatus]|uniref:Type IV pilus modification protein PilV n=1 Tax=Diaphorobacter aerolatus TaxID=1288495 RepID=A0A7H0GGB0_9BURK|nr:type IV pilus modification protein PilV [Diaphorobacter aerolatus]QNP47326.1 type IV pilus modification protein PilV [Diaphorobacter aerolatus]